MAGSQPELFLSQRVSIVAAPFNDALNQLIAVGGDVFDLIPGVFQCVQQVDGRCRRVQAHGVSDAGVLGGIVAEDYGDALFPVGLAAQGCMAGSQARHVVHAVGLRDITLHPAR